MSPKAKQDVLPKQQRLQPNERQLPTRKRKGENVQQDMQPKQQKLKLTDLDEEQRQTLKRSHESVRITWESCAVKFTSQCQESNCDLENCMYIIKNISVHGMKHHVLLEGHDARGIKRQKIQTININEDIEDFFEVVEEKSSMSQPMNLSLLEQCLRSDSGISKKVNLDFIASKESCLPLKKIEPLFQLKNPSLDEHDISFNPKKEAKAKLSALYTLRGSELVVWKAERTDGVKYVSRRRKVNEFMHDLIASKETREKYLNGSLVPPFQKVGNSKVDGWQIRMAAEYRYKISHSKGSRGIVDINNSQGRLLGYVTTQKYDWAILLAESGVGKTRFGALCAYDIYTVILAPKGTLDHWKRECKNLGTICIQLCPGKKNIEDVRKHLEEYPLSTIITTRECYEKNIDKISLPNLLIADEFHNPLSQKIVTSIQKINQKENQTTFLLGLTGDPFEKSIIEELSSNMDVKVTETESVITRIPKNPGIFPQVRFIKIKYELSEIEKTVLRICWDAGENVSQKERHKLLIFPYAHAQSARVNGKSYRTKLADFIMIFLNTELEKLVKQIASIVSKANEFTAKDQLVKSLEDDLSSAMIQRIMKKVEANKYTCNNRISLKQAVSEKDDAMKKYINVSNAWFPEAKSSHFNKLLLKNLAEIEQECPICWDTIEDWTASITCGHIACKSCASDLVSECPVCRKKKPQWISREKIMESIIHTKEDESIIDTSTKFNELIKIIRDQSDPNDKFVIIVPQTFIKSTIEEMSRLGIELTSLNGSGIEEERNLKKWQTGSFRGLVCPPGKAGVNMNKCTTMIILTTLLKVTDCDYRQTIRRIIRRDSEAFKKGIPLKIYILFAKNTEEDDEIVLRKFERISLETNA